nr:hypothetical protein [Tanacetum cinerariifolium]
DNHMFSTIKLLSRHQNMQQFGALLPIELTNEEIRNSNAYKEYYAIATGATPPKPKASGKQVAKATKAKSLSALFEVAMTEAQQLNLVTKRSLQQTHISQASGYRTDEETGADEGAGSKPGFPMYQLMSQRKNSPKILLMTKVMTMKKRMMTVMKRMREMMGSCKSLVELEYHLEEVFKATIDQLDWVNPEGQQYPHNLLKPLPLIPNNRGRNVIPFEHFINNDLEYLRGGASSHKYTTYVTKTKAADYGHIKWIEDLVPRTMWMEEPIGYDKHALCGVSHWGHKRQQFYRFAVNRESAHDVYSKRRIIAVTELKIVEWHNYKHLDWITVRRDDDKIYKFKEVDLKRLHIQDIEDLLLLLVQGKLNNLTVKERFAFNVSLRIFTRSIVIQRRVEDLQLAVESYQKKLNLSKPDSYRSDLKCKEAYTAYSNPRGFIYQNKDKKNRLIQINELHNFSDGTLTDVRTALDDRLKGI